MPPPETDSTRTGLFMGSSWHDLMIGLVLLAVPTATLAQNHSAPDLGPFASQTDVGHPALEGSAVYDPQAQVYVISGAGKNMWFDRDECHFVWKRMKGDFILRARAQFLGPGVDPHRKLGWMVRSNLDAASPHACAVVHGDGLTSLQYRRTAGAETEEIKSTLKGADVIQLERRGRSYILLVARFGEPFVSCRLENHSLGEEVYVGLFLCSHNAEVTERALFKEVRLTIPAPEHFVPYRDYIGSRLETLDVDTGDRRVWHETTEAIEAPNWTRDGSALIFNSRGRLHRFDLADQTLSEIDTGIATRCNNDHVISFDGRFLGISHHAPEAGGQSVISTLPVTGGNPRRVTDKAPAYLHGWSPDGQFLLFTGARHGEFDIYRIPVNGGEEVRLTTARGLDDGSEYSPDGNHIYFNSARTGTMQLWRMKPDGSGQEQLTGDEFNDWFPHVSPDGRRIAFLSFAKEVAPEDHPHYKQVYLRIMPVRGGNPAIVAYLYGGQGTINVPSWAPDSRRLAFVSHTGP